MDQIHSIIYAIFGFQCTLILLLLVMLYYERDRSFKRERSLIHRIMAKSITELAETHDVLNTSPADSIKRVALENELATKAVKIEADMLQRQRLNTGIPIT